MIGKDSPLRLLPRDLDARQSLIFDGIRYAAEMADLAYGRLRLELVQLSTCAESGGQPSSFTPVFCDAWTIVDSAN